MPDKNKLADIADKLDIGNYHRHVFICIGNDCCQRKEGEAAWEKLKSELKKAGLSSGKPGPTIYRTKAGCLRVCHNGPIAVVYPEGTWYSGLTEEKIAQFVESHLINGQPIEEWIFARNPLPNEALTAELGHEPKLDSE